MLTCCSCCREVLRHVFVCIVRAVFRFLSCVFVRCSVPVCFLCTSCLVLFLLAIVSVLSTIFFHSGHVFFFSSCHVFPFHLLSCVLCYVRCFSSVPAHLIALYIYYGFTARVRASMRAIPACIRAGIARIQASTRCSKTCIACFENDSSSVYTKQTAALCMHRHSTNIPP